MSNPARSDSSCLSSPLGIARRHGGWLAAICVFAGMTAWACGDSASGGAGGLGGAGATSASTSKSSGVTKATATTNTTQTATTDTTAAGLGCNPPMTPPSNGMCVTFTSGTTTTASSSASSGGGGGGAGSGGGGGGAAVTTSASSGSGGPAVACNPVTNEPCEAGFACDAAEGGRFGCFEPPNDSLTCEACNVNGGPFCAPGNTCSGGVCARFCCSDEDCGDVPCVKEDGGAPIFPTLPELGICPIG